MKSITIVALLLLVCTAGAQNKPACPLQVLKPGPYGARWTDNGGPKELRIESMNVGDKEIDAAIFRIIYKDMLGRETGRGLTEPAMVHESGHKTMRPGKKGGNYYDWDILHPHDSITVEVTFVRFTDGTTWEEPKKQGDK
jgi:hypothetical protein